MKNYFLITLALISFSCSQKPRFELMDPEKTGIHFNNEITETDSLHVMSFEYIYNGAGVGIVDLNNDELQDLIFMGNQVSPRIYLNNGDFSFQDITSGFPGIDNGQWYSGVCYVDINNDGWQDLYFTCTAYEIASKRKNRFWINQGIQEDGRLLFREMAESYGIADTSFSVHASFFDYDNDSDLDLYLMNNFVNDRLSASYRPKQNDGTAVSNDDLYRNNGDGTFTNVTIEAGIVYEGFGLGLALGDVNKDGWTDLYISNDYVSNDLLYINQQDGTFENEIARYLSYQTKSSMGNDMADINNDGNPDMYTLDMMPEAYYKMRQTINGFAYIYFINDAKYGYEHQFLRNMLHLHSGFIGGEMIPYSEVGQMMGIYKTEWSWSPLFADYDNDGDKDLLIANGYPKDLTDKDWTKYKANVWNFVASDQHLMDRAPVVKAFNKAYENTGQLKFEQRSSEWFDEIPSFSYGAAFVDLDHDGDLDYVTNNINDKAFVYKNTTVERSRDRANYLRIKLVGKKNNVSAFGAKVEIWSGDSYQFHEHFLTRGYTSTVDPVVHFGLSDRLQADSIRVTWPSANHVSYMRNVAANQVVVMNEQDASEPDGQEYESHTQEDLLFSRKYGVLDYFHDQEDFIDFYYEQPAIPHKFSQIGPRMQQGDLDGDGLEDLIVGATNRLPTRVFLRSEQGFIEKELRGLTGMKEFSEAGFAVVDVDSDGDNDVIALAGGYEQRDESKYVHYLYRNNGGLFTRERLPVDPFSAAVVRPADFDHDGDVDLFIGSRIKVEMFPFATDSWILVNDQGNFTREAAMNFNLGMVTDAVWSDYDGDGWEDLIVAREWNSLMFIRNLEGERLLSQELEEIESMHGVWYCITPGDFDRDGDPDYILGNLGENHRYTISDQYPLRLYALDIDMNGSLDPIRTGYWPDQHGRMTEYPVNYMDELVGQSPYFLQKFENYTNFSYAPFSEILDTAMRNRVDYMFHVNSSSSYILWNNGDSFLWEELPRETQVSVIKHTLVEDFNDDGYPDVLLAGNDHSYDISTGFYDALKGIVLQSKNKEPLSEVVPASESGIMLHGMVESLLLLEGDPELVIAGMNRDSVRVFSIK